MSYEDGSFGFDNLYVVSVFPGKVEDDYHDGYILIFIQYGRIYSSILGKSYIYSGQVVKAIYNSNNKNYTSIESVKVAYPVEILYI